MGVNKFIFEATPPDLKRIPSLDILGVTVILLTCSYDDREFVRVGYYVNNEYDSEELNADPPAKPIIERVKRNILAEKPRVTRFAIKWYAAWQRGRTTIKRALGTLKTLLLPNSLLSSQKPTSSKMTVPPTVRKKSSLRKLSSKKKLRSKLPRAKTMKCSAVKIPAVP